MLRKINLKSVLPYLILLTLAIIFLFSLLSRAHSLGWEDWDQFCFFGEVPRNSILEYHQFPFWNPYATGGRPLLANPQVGILSPNFIITLIFGCVIGLKLQALLMVFAGMVGMFLLSKYYKMNPIAGILTASVFGMSGFFSLRIYAGHFNFLLFSLVPYILLFFLKSFENKKYIIFSSIALAGIILDIGLVHVIPATLIFFSFYAFILSIQKKSSLPLINIALIFLLAFGISAIRTFPTYNLVSEHPRGGDPSERINIYTLYHVLLNNQLQSQDEMGQVGTFWRWHEYGAYVGFLPLIVFLIGIVIFFTSQFPLILSGLLMLIISLGGFSNYSPWTLMHKFPFLSSLHIPTRFIVLFIFVLAIIVGLLIDWLWKKSDKTFCPPKCLLFLIAILIIVDLIAVNTPLLATYPNNLPPTNISRNVTFTQIIDHSDHRSGALSSMYYNFLENKGTLNAYDPLPYDNHAKAVGDKDYKGEVYLENIGNASYKYWSPNKLVVSINSTKPARIIINQNYDNGWYVKNGKAENFKGLLSAQVQKGVSEITFYYLPTSFVIGAIVSLLTISGVMFFFLKKPKIKYWKKIRNCLCKFFTDLCRQNPF